MRVWIGTWDDWAGIQRRNYDLTVRYGYERGLHVSSEGFDKDGMWTGPHGNGGVPRDTEGALLTFDHRKGLR